MGAQDILAFVLVGALLAAFVYLAIASRKGPGSNNKDSKPDGGAPPARKHKRS